MYGATTPQQWSDRADQAEEAILARHLRRLWALPGTGLGVVAWPPVLQERLFGRWHYWWQAHFIDCAVDAAQRSPTAARRRRIASIARAHRLRNLTGWTNNYYDDMAWLGIALERAERLQLVEHRSAIAALEKELYDSWAPEIDGGIPWCKGSDFFNAPANGPAGIMLLRTGKIWRAREIGDWIDANLRDPDSGLIFDGIRLGGDRTGVERAIYSYCQGVVLGLETELAVQFGDARHHDRVQQLVAAVDERLTHNGVIVGGGGGDGGLFNGILARYLAVVALDLPEHSAADEQARLTAARIVTASAEAAWSNSITVQGLPLFSRDWSIGAEMPRLGTSIATFSGGTVHSSDIAERDFSVQLGGWMLTEAAARLVRES